MENEYIIGQRIGFVKKEQFMEDTRTIRQYYSPKIEVNGRLMCVIDESTISGSVECSSKSEALNKAKEIRDRNLEINENKK